MPRVPHVQSDLTKECEGLEIVPSVDQEELLRMQELTMFYFAVDFRTRSHLATTTQNVVYVVSTTFEMGCMVTNVAVHT